MINIRTLLLTSCLPLALVACKAGGGAAVSGAGAAAGGPIELVDPSGDDNGPGEYKYPTDQVYKPGSFDMTKLEIVPSGDTVEFRLSVASRIEDPWDSKAWGGNGFSVQMAFIHIDTSTGTGVQDSLPGTNVRFAADQAWDRVVLISPQGPTRVNSEIEAKAPQWKDKIIVPQITRATGKTLIAVVPVSALGGAPKASWGYQVLMQSNEGFPAKTDLLTRKVNEFEGQHRFGGGTDYDNDPHAIDIFAGAAKGAPDEAAKQHEILKKYNKDATEPKPEDLAVVPMIYPGK
ncbi:hypothetical protein L6R52_14750 [Myxococcota bacterium]|nr:hypothetical protein [Myxococcota bacterium]